MDKMIGIFLEEITNFWEKVKSYVKNKIKKTGDTRFNKEQKILSLPIIKMLERKNNEQRRIGI